MDKKLHNQNIFKSEWLNHIKTSLDNAGFSYLFNERNLANKNQFKNLIKLRLKDIYDQKWVESVSNNSICLNYRAMNTQKKLKEYLLNLPSQYKFALCKFKCASHKLPIVAGRYAGLAIDDRMCTLCDTNEIGDEYHYLYQCSYFNVDRSKYLKKYYYINPNMHKTLQLFNVTDKKEILNLAKFTYQIIEHFKSN